MSISPAPAQVPDPGGPAPKKVEPVPDPVPGGNCTPGDICVK